MRKLMGLAAAAALTVAFAFPVAAADNDNQPAWPGCKGELTSATTQSLDGLGHLNLNINYPEYGIHIVIAGVPGDVNKGINAICKRINATF